MNYIRWWWNLIGSADGEGRKRAVIYNPDRSAKIM